MTTLAESIVADGGCIVSTNTLLATDLVPAFLDTLRGLSTERAEKTEEEYSEILMVYHSKYVEELTDDGREAVDWLRESLQTALEEEAPEGFYFGTSEGDGACFGFFAIEPDDTDEEDEEDA